MGTGNGYGKTILFGEHFVVYGLPAIASALGSKTEAEVKVIEGSSWEVDDQRPATPGYKKKKYDEAQQAIQNVIEHLNIDTSTKKLQIRFSGDLFAASGVGASAAQVTSLARALDEEFNLGLSDEQINKAAYEGERGYHGTPSGIDNTVSTFGGLIWFVRTAQDQPNIMEKVKAGKQMLLVIANTGVTTSTTEVVEDVKQLKEDKPDEFGSYLSTYKGLVEEARVAVEAGDEVKVGELMDQNHALLQKITVSGEVNDKLVAIARTNGALGAKMTGTGRGGLVIALAPDVATQQQIAEAINQEGYTTWLTTIG